MVEIDDTGFTEKVGEIYLEGLRSKVEGQKVEGQKVEGRRSEAVVEVDPRYFRPTEVDMLIGDPTKAQTQLGWKPEYDLKGLVKDMMQSDVHLMKKEAYLKEGGYRTMNYFE